MTATPDDGIHVAAASRVDDELVAAFNRLLPQLSRSASVPTRKEDHRVVDTGPYRLVRHPMYTGFMVMYIGMAVLCATVLALVAVPVITLGLWLKARVEEQFLIEELGAVVYGAYKARTPMLVPRRPRRSS
jgi:protein-S-isoprenylcysteine O-methyltransferase Ste14